MPRGLSLPLSPLGIANLAPLPPWHYGGAAAYPWAAAAQLAAIHQAATGEPELITFSFTDAAQMSQTYETYQKAIAARPTMELAYLDTALAGSRRRVNALTGRLPLLRL